MEEDIISSNHSEKYIETARNNGMANEPFGPSTLLRVDGERGRTIDKLRVHPEQLKGAEG